MKKSSMLLTLILLAGSLFSFAQVEDSMYPTRVSKAVAFAESKPLTELAAVLSPTNVSDAAEPKEVHNELDYDKWNRSAAPDLPAAHVQTAQGSKIAKGLITSFKGQNSMGGFSPPDTDGDVNDEHFVQVVNSNYSVYDRNGNKLLGPLHLSTLWQSLPGPWVGTNNGDPIVVYDEEYERWVITQFALPGNSNYELFAVSKTKDPLGEYYLYAFSFGTQFNDYPKIGVWSNGYGATYNLFTSHNGKASFIGSKITMVERAKMVNGDPNPAMIEFLKNGWYSSMPADVDGTNMPATDQACPIMYIRGDRKIIMMELSPNWSNPSSSTLSATNILSPNYFTPRYSKIPAPSPNVSGLDALGNMVMNRLAYRKFADHESMVVNHTVQSGGVAAIRWYEFRKSGSDDWSIYQQGTYAPGDDLHRWMGSIAMNANGDIALGYSVANSTTHPSIRATGRLASDPLGSMTVAEINIKEGTNSQSGYRWGDYACMNVDPNGSDFWFTTEYSGWSTWIAALNLSGDAPAPTANAGEDGEVCKNKKFYCQGQATSWQSVKWTTDGDGAFIGSTTLNAKYIRGTGDIAKGSATLTLTVTGLNGDVVSDDVKVSYNPFANAGEDMSASSASGQATLAGQSNTATTVEWTTDGDGTFADASALNTVYTAGPNDKANGFNNVTLKVTTDGCSGTATDQMKISWTDGVEEDLNSYACKVYPNPTNDVFTLELNRLNSQESFTYIIYTSTGSEIFREVVNTHNDSYKKQINMSAFVPGLYFITIQTAEGNKTVKLMKQ